MIDRIRKVFGPIWPGFYRQEIKLLNPYMTFTSYGKIWAAGIFVLVATALIPLLVVTAIHYQLLEQSVDSELRLRTERLASNARRAVTFFMEERLDALRFSVNEISYDRLINADHLSEILRNLKLGFGGLTDLSVIDHTGKQVTYAGPFNLEGRDYSNQRWFIECQKHHFYVSEIFRGYRDVPHIIIAGVNDGVLPFEQTRIDESHQSDIELRERCLLHVASSRARYTLTVTSYGKPRRFVI